MCSHIFSIFYCPLDDVSITITKGDRYGASGAMNELNIISPITKHPRIHLFDLHYVTTIKKLKKSNGFRLISFTTNHWRKRFGMTGSTNSGTVFPTQTNTRMTTRELLGARRVTSRTVTLLSTFIFACVMMTNPGAWFPTWIEWF